MTCSFGKKYFITSVQMQVPFRLRLRLLLNRRPENSVISLKSVEKLCWKKIIVGHVFNTVNVNTLD